MSAASPAIETVERGTARDRLLRRTAALLAVVAILSVLGIIAFAAADDRLEFDLNLVTLGFYGSIVTFATMGALIVQRRPTTRVAWLMLAAGVGVGLGLFGYSYGVAGQGTGPYAPLPFALPVMVVAGVFFIPSLGATWTWIFLLYPTDRLLEARWRWVGAGGIACAVAFVVGTLFAPGELDDAALPGVENPLGIQGDLGTFMTVLGEAGNYVGLVFLSAAALSLVVRYRRADAVVRAQIRWLAVVAVLAVVAFAISLLPLPGLDGLMFGLGLVLAASMPVAIGIAITRYHLYDIDRLINRALVYGSLTAILAGVFTAGVGLAQRLFVAVTNETSDAALVGTTLVVATLYAPLRKRLEAIVDRRFKFEQRQFGAYRDEVTRLLTLTDERLAAERLVREAVSELSATGAAVIASDGTTLASAGTWPVAAALTLRMGTGRMASLALGPRRGGEAFHPGDVAALEDLVRLVAISVRPAEASPAPPSAASSTGRVAAPSGATSRGGPG